MSSQSFRSSAWISYRHSNNKWQILKVLRSVHIRVLPFYFAGINVFIIVAAR